MPPTNSQKKKTKKKNPAPAPAQKKTNGPGQEQETTPAPAPASILPDKPDIHPSREILYLALQFWRLSRFPNMFYKIERTFSHHRIGEQYGTEIIFEQLELINNGEHAELLEEMNAFCDTVLDEFDAHLAEKADNS
jgi:hypothetical protein